VPYLILSDIHSNYEALSAVLEQARGRYSGILCLGDLVGYGADPNPVTEWARSSGASVIRGNHDRACTGTDLLEYFNPAARASAFWTRGALSAENRSYLERLPSGPLRVHESAAARTDFSLVHGSPLDEDEYLVDVGDVRELSGYIDTKLTFFGHTHLQGGFLLAPRGVKRILPDRILELEHDYQYLINPGSVGQPRDGDPRAAFAIVDEDERSVELYRLSYPIEAAQAKILKAGLPEVLAQRLAVGR